MNNNLSQPFASIIVPVYNNSGLLRKCLQALESQSFPRTHYEIIVIDNDSTERIIDVTNDFPNVILGFEKKIGSYAARNTGITIASGNILAFTDSDCIPTETWIENGVHALLDAQNCGLVAGKVDFFFKNPDTPNASEFYDLVNCLDQKKYVKTEKFGATANIFTFAQIFQEFGLFDANLKSGGDKEWGQRIAEKGLGIYYTPDAVVMHPARTSFKELRNKRIRLAFGIYDRLKQQVSDADSKPDVIQDVLWHLKPPIKFMSWRLSDSRLKGIHRKISYVFITIFLNYSVALMLIRLRYFGATTENRRV